MSAACDWSCCMTERVRSFDALGERRVINVRARLCVCVIIKATHQHTYPEKFIFIYAIVCALE